MKKLCTILAGAVCSLSVNAMASDIVEIRHFDCQSDAKVFTSSIGFKKTAPEFVAYVSEYSDKSTQFTVKKYYVLNNDIKFYNFVNENAKLEDMNSYLTIQGREWALAIAPEKKRGSLYSSNPDINEIPMFCLSSSLN